MDYLLHTHPPNAMFLLALKDSNPLHLLGIYIDMPKAV